MKEIESRQIRVFISSTFRDMKEERDHLVKFTFPQLRKLCESRGVVWGEVDLRWGVTDEQKAEGKVLPICLEEIKRCRPYFIGLLGERYGWIPDAIPPEVIEREPWLAEHIHARKSVTELEILHGVLNNPDMAEHAFFYFRDPAYVDSLPPEAKKDFTAESAEDAQRLRNLKERILASRFPARDGYRNPKVVGRAVLRDLRRIINQRWPEGSQPDPLDREAMDHEAYAQSRERVYIGRPEYFAKLDAHADGTGDQPLVILGESGCGKSALLANWVTHYRQTHPNVLILQHYIGATPYSADWAAMLRRLMGEFKRHLGIQQDIPDKPDTLRGAFPNWLHMAAAKGRIVLVLDALNQLEDRDGAPDLVWLPPVMPENLRLIVSTLPGRPLDEIKQRAWPTLNVEPLSQPERERLIGEYLAQYAKALSPARVQRIAAAPQSANPLYLRVLLDELRLSGEHERLEERIDYHLQTESPRDLYSRVIVRWEQDYAAGTTLVSDALSLLWAARRGLSETELLEALGKDGQPLPRAAWSPLYLAMSDGLVSRAGLLTFAHDFLRIAVQDAYLPTEKQQWQAHLRLADHFQQQSSGPRRTDELPWQLAEAKAWDRLYVMLVDPAVFDTFAESDLNDLNAFWSQIEANTPHTLAAAYALFIDDPRRLGTQERCLCLHMLLRQLGYMDETLRLFKNLREQGLCGEIGVSLSLLAHHAWSLHLVGRSSEAISILTEMQQHCTASSDKFHLAVSLGTRAAIVRPLGQLEEAMLLHQQEESLYREIGYWEGISISLGNQALILQDRGDLDGAMALCKQEERICRQLGDVAGLESSLGNHGLILYDRGDLDGAMALYKEQERICRQLGNMDGLQASLGDQGLVLQARGDLDGAMALYKEQERICRQLSNLSDLSTSLGSQGGILYARGDLDGAMALHKEQERICRQLGNVNGLHASLDNQGAILYARGDLDGAMALHEEAERICRQLGNMDGLQASLGNQGLVLQARGDLDGAMALLKERERICRQLGSLTGLSASLGNQGVILHIRGDLDGAMALLKKRERICRQLGNLDGLQQTLGNQALILADRGDLDGAMALHKEEERICHQLGNVNGLAYSLSNQSLMLSQMGRVREGLPLVEQAYQLATGHGYVALAKQIEPILSAVRQAAQES